MEHQKEIRHSRSYAFGSSLHEKLQKLANKHHNGNRSRMTEELIEAGILALDAQKPEQAARSGE